MSLTVSPRGEVRRAEMAGKKNTEASQERTRVWSEPKGMRQERKVAVVYYLCRNGQLEHPHFMEVPLSSSDGLYLRDVTNHFNFLRGKGIASMYSWSSKRSYKNGFVWHDLSENDFIYPTHGHEYVLKGSEIVNCLPPRAKPSSSVSYSSKESKQHQELSIKASPSSISDQSSDTSAGENRKISDVPEYKVYKTDSPAEFYAKAADASTQTEDRKNCGRRKASSAVIEEVNQEDGPPPATSSSSGTDGKDQSETLETLMNENIRLRGNRILEEPTPELSARAVNHARIRASAVLIQLISCGSLPVNRSRPHRHSRTSSVGSCTDMESTAGDRRAMPTSFRLEEEEYFSGNLIDTQKECGIESDVPRLKRSSSYNAHRVVKSQVTTEKEREGVRAKCIPRKPTRGSRKEGSKSITDEPTKQAAE